VLVTMLSSLAAVSMAAIVAMVLMRHRLGAWHYRALEQRLGARWQKLSTPQKRWLLRQLGVSVMKRGVGAPAELDAIFARILATGRQSLAGHRWLESVVLEEGLSQAFAACASSL
jgi:hypothetical protein